MRAVIKILDLVLLTLLFIIYCRLLAKLAWPCRRYFRGQNEYYFKVSRSDTQKRVRKFPIFNKTMSLILKKKLIHYGTELLGLLILGTEIWDLVTGKIRNSQILSDFKVGFI